MKRAIFLLLVLLSLCGSLSACSYEPSEDSSPAYSFCDDLGNGISISYSPKRVAVLFSSLADIWCLAGGEVAITVGESVEREFASGSAVLVDSGAGKTVKQKSGNAPGETFALRRHLSPTLRSMQYDRSAEPRGKFKLSKKRLAHNR